MTTESSPPVKSNMVALIGMVAGLIGVISLGLGFIISTFFISENTSLYFTVLFDCGFLFGLTAVITGNIGRSRIRKSDGVIGGKGLVLASLILGNVVIVIILLFALFITNILLLVGYGIGPI
jgi:hypothetical protein